jgi:hypothetical protein
MSDAADVEIASCYSMKDDAIFKGGVNSPLDIQILHFWFLNPFSSNYSSIHRLNLYRFHAVLYFFVRHFTMVYETAYYSAILMSRR